MKLLHIDASVLGENSVSRQLSAAIVKRLREAEPATEITYYDLAAKPIDQLTGPVFAAIQGVSPGTPPCCRSSLSVRRRLKTFLPPTSSLSVPRCTTISSQLKAWIDRVVIRGKTLRYTRGGAGRPRGRQKAIIASTRGGFYGPETPTAFLDHQESYFRGILGFMGITDVIFIRAEGVAVGADQRKTAIEIATAAVTRLAT
jgi:FMN-dependent NADH-azoreductase